MKKVYLILLMTNMVLFLSYGAVADTYNASIVMNQDIATLFSCLDSELIGMEISGIAKVNKQQMTLNQIEQLFNEAIDHFEHIVGPEIETDEALSASVRQIKGQALCGDVFYSIALNNGFNVTEGGSYETYIMVNAAFESMSEQEIENVKQTLLNFLKCYSEEPCIGTLYRGRIQKKLDKKTMLNTSKQIFDAFEGKIIEGIEDGHLVSKTGYSSVIENSLDVDGEKINLNVALRYNGYEDATYIWLGTPVIFTSY